MAKKVKSTAPNNKPAPHYGMENLVGGEKAKIQQIKGVPRKMKVTRKKGSK